MTDQLVDVYAGVDTHKDTHTAAVVDPVGRVVATHTFAATETGYEQLRVWLNSHGQLIKVGIEGTGSYGASLSTHLLDTGAVVKEILRPDRSTRRRLGKTDTIDAIAAARAVASDHDDRLPDPKSHHGVVASITMIRTVFVATRKDATKTRNRFQTLLITAPTEVRELLTGLPSVEARIALAASWRPGTDLTDPTTTAKAMLKRLAKQYQQQHDDVEQLRRDLDTLTRHANPALRAVPGVGPDVAATLLTTVGANPTRIRSEAAFAALCATNPIPASSGKTNRHRLNRGGDRQANNALWRIALSRMRFDPATKDYVTTRTQQGRTKAEIIRCLTRYIARQLYPILINPPQLSDHTDLRPLREHLNLTLAQASTHTGLAASHLSMLERGRELHQTHQHQYRTWLHQQHQLHAAS